MKSKITSVLILVSEGITESMFSVYIEIMRESNGDEIVHEFENISKSSFMRLQRSQVALIRKHELSAET